MLRSRYHILKNLPIRRKLLVMSLLLSSFSIVALSTTFLINEFLNYRTYVTSDITTQSRIVAQNIASSLVFQDPRSARETLSGLKPNKRIQAVAVFTVDKRLFVVHINNDGDEKQLSNEFLLLQQPGANHAALYHSLLTRIQRQAPLTPHPLFEEPVIVDGQQVGSVIMQSYLHDLYVNMLFLGLLIFVVAGLTLLVAILLGIWFQRLIASPIDALLSTMQQVSEHKDFSHRIPIKTTDELGQLVNSFNLMLAEIESRDQSLLERQQQLDQMAHYDNLTGLPNRTMLLDRLQQALHQARRYKLHMAILFIDLDHFKDINDSLGHKAGDELLKQVAARLDTMVRGSDTVARLGGDEFTICLHNVASIENACIVAQKVVDLYDEPFVLEGRACTVTGSVGVALYPYDGQTVEELLKAADTAMYHAKMKGKNTFQLYSSAMQMQVSERLTMQKNLLKAVDNGEFMLVYQPIVATDTGQIVAAEALLRWNHPELGILHPKSFLSVAEGNEIIHQIGTWVLSEACRQCVIWHRMGHPELQIAVNLSTVQFKKAGLAESVLNILQETGLPPASLQFDLNESIVQLTCDEALEQLTYTPSADSNELPCPYGTGHECALHPLYQFRNAGIQLAFDNFGTGHSSLGYLNHLPIDCIKVDRRFTSRTDSVRGTALLGAIIVMARTLGIQVVAEGVETEQQYTSLKEQGCERAQGYLTGRPMSGESLTALLIQQAQQKEDNQKAVN